MALMPKPILALSLAALLKAPLGAQAPPAAKAGQADREQPAPAAPMPEGDRIARWVASRSILYPSRDDRGEARTYSGRVYLPARAGHPVPVPLVLYVHGSDVAFNSLPQFNRGYEAMVGAMAAYFYDYVVAMPDLPGYGLDPSGRPHPYCHAQSLARCALDMVRPALGVLEGEPFRWDGRLFILGYSSGGFGALAAVRELENNPEYAGLPLTAAACMAGPFAFAESVRGYLADPAPYQRPDIPAYLIRAFHDLYPDGGIFAPETALHPVLLEEGGAPGHQGTLPQWLDRCHCGPTTARKIKRRLTGGPDTPVPAGAVVNAHWLRTQFLDPQWPDTPVGRILKENDLVGGWRPRAPMLLATSPTDECVPACNTYKLLEHWAQGDCGPVEMYPLTLLGRGVDHATGGVMALEKALRWFNGPRFRAAPRSRL